VMRNASMSDLLKDCIAFKGDVDTVATIALGAAAHSKEVIQDIPQHLIDTLENGTYGRDYLVQLDKNLLDLEAV
jgi:ADP-ribosyl-[dinitrogen reductase] hydrolase